VVTGYDGFHFIFGVGGEKNFIFKKIGSNLSFFIG